MAIVQPVYQGQPVYQSQIVQPVVQPMVATTVIQQPQSNSKLLVSVEGHRTWSSDLFDCNDERTSCCATCMFPCFTMCEVSRRLGENSLAGCCVGLVPLRARQRTMGGIKGSLCGDCAMVTFCGVCALCQMERELYHMGL